MSESSVRQRTRVALRGWICGSIALIGFTGCGEPIATSYRHQEQIKSIPDKHQKEIREILIRNYGSPVDPRWQVPQAADSDPAEENAKAPIWTARVDGREMLHGAKVFQQRCAGCHGETGDGAGPAAAYLDPKPRDYRQGKFKFISTPRGSKPRRSDLERIIRRGAKGTSMPSFPFMSDEDMEAVIHYVMALSYRGELELALINYSKDELEESDSLDANYVAELATALDANWANSVDQVVSPLTIMPKRTPESVAAGAKVFLSNNCVQCHGKDGRGGRNLASDQAIPKDDWGELAYAADLTSGMLHGGRRPIDLYRRILVGINGSPMPGFAETFKDDPDKIWQLVHFVLHVSEGGEIPSVTLDSPPSEPATGAAETEAAPAAEAVKGDSP
jgi:mono/diheme cytochrome c family protein